MSVTFKAAASVINGTAGTSVVVSKPTGAADGDFLLAFIAQAGTGSVTPPAGWALVGSLAASTTVTLAVYSRRASGEPASWTWTLGGSVRNWGAVGAYLGVDPTSPISVTNSHAYTSAGTNFGATGVVPWSGLGVGATASVRAAGGAATTWTANYGGKRVDVSTNAGAGTDIAGVVADVANAADDIDEVGLLFVASQSQAQAVWWSVSLNPVLPIRRAGQPLDVRVELAFGADPSADPSAWTWSDVSTYVKPGVTIRRGRSSETSTVEPSGCNFTLNNRDGRFTPRNAQSTYYPNVHRNIPVRVRVLPTSTAPCIRFVGFVSEFAPRWPTGEGAHAEVGVSAAGALRRLAQGKALRSPLYRASIRNSSGGERPVAYWPMEDPAGSTTFASALGQNPMYYYGPGGIITLAADNSFAGSSPLPRLGLGATVAATVASYPVTGSWTARWAIRIPNAVTVASQVGEIDCGGTLPKWELWWNPGTPNFLSAKAYDTSGVEQLADAGVNISHPDGSAYAVGEQAMLQLSANQNGGNIDWQYIVILGLGGVGKVGSKAGTVGNVNAVHGTSLGSLDQVTFGHFAVYDSVLFPPADYAAIGYQGELATARLSRLVVEENITGIVETDSANASALLGAQSQSRFLDLAREAEAADEGLLTELLTTVGIRYRPRTLRYNRAVDLTLDINRGQVKVPWEPADDDRFLVNDQTLSRTGGSSFRATDSAHIAANDEYQKSDSVNLGYDADLQWHAQWRVHLGTVDEARYPSTSWDLNLSPELMAAWRLCDVGSRINVLNPLPQWPPGALDLLLDGWTEYLDVFAWRIDANTSPARPWEVFAVEDARLGRLESDGSFVFTSIGPTATALSVWTPSGPLWTIADGAFDIDVAGEQMTTIGIVNYLNSNPYFETTLSPWTGQNNATVTRDGTQFHEGAFSMKVTPDGVTAAPQAQSEQISVVAGRSYVASAWLRTTSNATRVFGVYWFDGAGGFLSSNTASAALVAGVWTQYGPSTYTAPANATFARLKTNDPGTPAAANTWFVDEATLVDPTVQVFTVVRSVNTVVKDQLSTNAVQLWRGGVAAA